MAYAQDSIHERPSHLAKNIYTLKNKHFKYKDINSSIKIDVLTIGDSYSNAAMQGRNPYYQDYIATNNHYNVLNIPPFTSLNTIVYTLNNIGLLDEIKPKYIILESVQRKSTSRFSGEYSKVDTPNKEEIISKLINYRNSYTNKEIGLSFLYGRNLNTIKYNVQYKFNKYRNYLYFIFAELNNDYFSVKNSKDLLFYAEDIYLLEKVNQRSVGEVNKYMNDLAHMLKKKNIQLYFMPVVDKYELYSKYLINNPYPKSIFFEELRKLPKEYKLIDTKVLLEEELDKGEKDIFYADDTHWSSKASEAIFKDFTFE